MKICENCKGTVKSCKESRIACCPECTHMKDKKISRVFSDSGLQRCYELGVDSKLNGVNEDNSHFSLFNSPDKCHAWERGRRDYLKYE